MKKYNTLTKIVLYVSVISGIIWTGSYLLRMFLFYQLFTVRNFELKEYLAGVDLDPVFYTLLPAVSTTFFAYIIFLISFLLFFFLAKIKLRENGWFFISTVIIAITAPFEIYLMTIDAEMLRGIFYNTARSGEILNLVIRRFKNLSSFPVIELFGYFTIFYLVLFKPLTRKYED